MRVELPDLGEPQAVNGGGALKYAFRCAWADAKKEFSPAKLIDGAAKAVAVVACTLWALKITGLYGPLGMFLNAHGVQILQSVAIYFLLIPVVSVLVRILLPIVKYLLLGGK